jgi:hypothetical protein
MKFMDIVAAQTFVRQLPPGRPAPASAIRAPLRAAECDVARKYSSDTRARSRQGISPILECRRGMTELQAALRLIDAGHG